jgi:hypothetical protein
MEKSERSLLGKIVICGLNYSGEFMKTPLLNAIGKILESETVSEDAGLKSNHHFPYSKSDMTRLTNRTVTVI